MVLVMMKLKMGSMFLYVKIAFQKILVNLSEKDLFTISLNFPISKNTYSILQRCKKHTKRAVLRLIRSFKATMLHR